MLEQKNKPIKILLADDDEDDRELFTTAVNEAELNAGLKTVKDGKQLMEYLGAADGNHPDIIFLDINMPCLDGKQCLEEIRANKKLDQVPVVMFTTSTYNHDIDETFKKGASLFVTKPYSYKDLITIIKKILSMNWQKELLNPEKSSYVFKLK